MSADFVNPVDMRGADPWVVRSESTYYYCGSLGGKGIFVGATKRLQDLGLAEKVAVWLPPEDDRPYSKEIWAPELHNLDGKWYIYFAADDGDNANHRMYVLESKGSDAMGPYAFKGKLAPTTDRWAIDGTVLQASDGKRYFIWSGWDGYDNVAQNLYIARMKNAWTLAGDRVCISRPTYAWEQIGVPLVNEGPQVLKHGDKTYVVYSASGSWTDDYCLGQLTLKGKDPMAPKSWMKKASPVFSKTAEVFGPGHASFTTSVGGSENWIVYHSARASGAGWDRKVNLQPFKFGTAGDPVFGRPEPPGKRLKAPSEK